jgi:DNA-binding response OmpR family regulator
MRTRETPSPHQARQPARRGVAPEGVLTGLVVSPRSEDRLRLREIFGRRAWKLYEAATRRQGLALLSRCTIPIVVCERSLPDGSWKDVLSWGTSLASPPRLIVTSGLADDSFWAEVLNLGAYDVLLKPLDELEVSQVLGMAWLDWRRNADSDKHRNEKMALSPTAGTAMGGGA